MNLTSMHAKFLKRTSGLGSLLTQAEINEYLNRFYQYMVPHDVGGDFSDGEWDLTCVPGQAVYPYPAVLVAPTGKGVNIYSVVTGDPLARVYWLDVETNAHVWKATDRNYPQSQGIPTSILQAKKNVYLDPIPDRDYIINIPARTGPTTPLGFEEENQDGIDNEVHAMCVVTGAAVEFLTDNEDHDGAAREADAYASYTSMLRTAAYSKPQHRRPIGTLK